MFGKKSSDAGLGLGPTTVQKMPSLGSILRRRKDSEEDSMGSSSSPASNSRKSSVLFFSRRKTAFEDVGVFKLSSAELAFLPNEVRTRLGRAVGHLPPAPSVFKSRGAVLFVDVSGFTKLGSELRNTHGPEKGAQLLAEQITSVLSTLTTICLDHGGDVSKFAGDALLCVWESGPEDSMFASAKDCAIAMLAAMRRIQSERSVKLDIHGGLARGSILHFHLGSADDRLRWYLMAGEAMAGAACLVDAASPGEIMCAETAETSRSVRAASQQSAFITGAHGNASSPRSAMVNEVSSPTPPHRPNALWSPRGAIDHPKSPAGSPTKPNHQIREVTVNNDNKNGSNNSMSNGTHDSSPPSSREQSLSSPAIVVANSNRSKEAAAQAQSRKRNDTVTRNTEQRQHFLFMAQLASGARVNRSDLSEITFAKPFEGRGTMLSITTDAMRERALSSMPPDMTHGDMARGRFSTSNSSSMETIVILTAESSTATSDIKTRGRIATEEDPVLRAGLPRTCNVYIPKALRRGAMEDVKSEMKKGVSIVFVDVEDMALSDEEMEHQTISDVKLDALNSSFVKMTRITHAFGGEVRDMLFDDKGCVFIAVFGAHNDEHEEEENKAIEPPTHPAQRLLEKREGLGGSKLQTTNFRTSMKSSRNLHNLALEQSSELRATKAALAINSAVESCRVGVSTGTCFVGMCGVEKRHDFIVIGHEVNMAARLMVQADRGQVIVSPEVHAIASRVLPFTERPVQMQKKNSTTTSTAYIPDQSTARRESFLAEYRYELFDSDLFVGRTAELESVEESINKMCLSSSSYSGCIVIDAELGMGKSAFVSRVRKMGRGRISICHGTCRDPLDDFHPWRSILETLTGLRPDMKVQEIKDALQNFESSTMKIDFAALARIFPFFTEIFNLPPPSEEDLQAREDDVFGEKHRRQIAVVGRTVASLLVMGNKASKRAGARGTLVVLENVEKIDVCSLLLLEYLVDHLDSAKRLALCLTAKTRQTQPSTNNMGRRASLLVQSLTETMTFETKRLAHVYLVVQKANRSKSKLSLTLNGLPKSDCETLVSRVLGHRASTEVNDCLYRLTKGCPMHLNMLLQYCKDHRLISRKGGAEYDWVKDAQKTVTTKPAMATIEGVIRQRFEEGLDAQGKNVLKLASIIQSGEFDAIFLAEGMKQAMGKPMPESDVLARLRQARSLGFVVHVEDKTSPEREHAWSFKHDTIADVIFATVPREEAIGWVDKIEEAYKALELRLKLGFFGRVDDFEKV